MSVTEKSDIPAPETAAPDLIGSGQDGTVRDQAVAYLQRVRSGDMGALPAIAGFVVLSILFAALSPFFLTERNFANLLTQAATLVMLAMALVFVILLGEIDLSAGVTSGVAMSLFVVLSDPGGLNMNWILALIVALLAGVAIGLLHRILRGESRGSVVRGHPGSVPRPPGSPADHHRRRRPLPHPAARGPRDPEQQHARRGRAGSCSWSS